MRVRAFLAVIGAAWAVYGAGLAVAPTAASGATPVASTLLGSPLGATVWILVGCAAMACAASARPRIVQTGAVLAQLLPAGWGASLLVGWVSTLDEGAHGAGRDWSVALVWLGLASAVHIATRRI